MTKRRQHYTNIIRNFATCPEAGAVNMQAYVDTEMQIELRKAKRELLQELRSLINDRGVSDFMNVVTSDKTVYLDAKWIFGAIDSMLSEYFY
jgi:hypothetical protein